MKTIILSVVLFSLSINVQAEIVSIFDIWTPEQAAEPHLVLTADGRVYEVNSDNQQLIGKLSQAYATQKVVELELDQSVKGLLDSVEHRAEIVDATLISDIEAMAKSASDLDFDSLKYNFVREPMDEYRPSVLPSMETTAAYFNTMNKAAREKSQCYNRAHVWSYELLVNYNIHSTKIWIFFTKKYIREFRFGWWFHVTPAVHVYGQSEPITLDRKYLDRPVTLTYWKNFFISNRANCPIITRYSDYQHNPWGEYCYLIESSMYFWQPFQIQNLETRKWDVRRNFLPGELRVAYNNGFGTRPGPLVRPNPSLPVLDNAAPVNPRPVVFEPGEIEPDLDTFEPDPVPPVDYRPSRPYRPVEVTPTPVPVRPERPTRPSSAPADNRRWWERYRNN